METQREQKDEAILAHTRVAPGATQKIVIGLFEDNIPVPNVAVELDATQKDSLETTCEREDGHGDYTLFYKLKNKSAETLDVTLRDLSLSLVG